METLQLHIEALVFTAQQAVTIEEMVTCLEKTLEIPIQASIIETYIEQLIEKYRHDQYSFELVSLGSGYRFLTKQPYHATIATQLNQKARKRLSTAALETIAIIAYKQPITKSDIEHIRGVNCDYSIQKLLEKELIEISGRSQLPGRPLLYCTTQLFMDYFGINHISELPKLKEVQPDSQHQIGSQEDIHIAQNA